MRKLLQPLFKLAAWLRYGRAGSHAFMWMPHLRLTKPEAGHAGEVFHRGRKVGALVSADVLVRVAPGEIYVIGSGPSVKACDFSRIPGRSAILLNGAIALVGQGLAPALAIAIEDERFIYRHFSMLGDKIDRETIWLLSVPVLRAICEIDATWFADRTIILIDNVRKPYGVARCEADELAANPLAILESAGKVGFSLDPDWGVFQGGSVVVSAMQFAVRCRPATIGIIGVDISNANQPRFYEDKGDMAKSGVARATDRIVSHLLLARRVAQSYGVTVHNHSSISVLRDAGFGYDPSLAAVEIESAAS
jgi:hypothetical protein